MGELTVQKVICKWLTNLEIRSAATGTQQHHKSLSESGLLYHSPIVPLDKSRPWLLLELSHDGETLFVALSRNSVDSCALTDENATYLGPPYVWRHHKHDSHRCKVINECGKVNFDLGKRSDAQTYWKISNPRSFLQANGNDECAIEDLDLLSSVVDSSHLVERLKAKYRAAPSPFFLSSLQPGVRK